MKRILDDELYGYYLHMHVQNKTIYPKRVPVYEEKPDVLHDVYKILNCDTVQEIDGWSYLPDYWCMKNVHMIIDEEGKLKSDLEPSLPLLHNRKVYDFIVGDFVCIGLTDDMDAWRPLTEKECDETLENIYTYMEHVLIDIPPTKSDNFA